MGLLSAFSRQFAVTHGLTSYDAVYVQLAIQHEATLATLDKAMRRAATRLNIPLLPV
jgi:predicted nucleic acid-binding protein